MLLGGGAFVGRVEPHNGISAFVRYQSPSLSLQQEGDDLSASQEEGLQQASLILTLASPEFEKEMFVVQDTQFFCYISPID
jgi:hypothetical protein